MQDPAAGGFAVMLSGLAQVVFGVMRAGRAQGAAVLAAVLQGGLTASRGRKANAK